MRSYAVFGGYKTGLNQLRLRPVINQSGLVLGITICIILPLLDTVVPIKAHTIKRKLHNRIAHEENGRHGFEVVWGVFNVLINVPSEIGNVEELRVDVDVAEKVRVDVAELT